MEINEDGSLVGQIFGGSYNGEYPSPKNTETYEEYQTRVKELVKEGFHLGNLSWPDWQTYCMGSGMYEGIDYKDKIGG
jgi:hypothetical protein